MAAINVIMGVDHVAVDFSQESLPDAALEYENQISFEIRGYSPQNKQVIAAEAQGATIEMQRRRSIDLPNKGEYIDRTEAVISFTGLEVASGVASLQGLSLERVSWSKGDN